MAISKLAMLAAHSTHVEPVDPSFVSPIVKEADVQGYIDAAMLALVLYNAYYVAKLSLRLMTKTHKV